MTRSIRWWEGIPITGHHQRISPPMSVLIHAPVQKTGRSEHQDTPRWVVRSHITRIGWRVQIQTKCHPQRLFRVFNSKDTITQVSNIL